MLVCLDLALSENGVPPNPSLYHHVPIRTTIWVYLVGPIVGPSQMSYCLSVVYPILPFVNCKLYNIIHPSGNGNIHQPTSHESIFHPRIVWVKSRFKTTFMC